MSDVENNMYDLFRRAAEGYPLKNAQDDWDTIASLLKHNTGSAGDNHRKKNLKKYSILLLSLSLLLLIAGFIANYSANKKGSPVASQVESKVKAEEIKEKDYNDVTAAVAAPDKKITDKQQRLNYTNDDNTKQDRLNTRNMTRLSKKRKYHYNISGGGGDNIASEKIPANYESGVTEQMFPKKISNAKGFIQIHHASEYAVNDFVLRQSISSVQPAGKKENITAEKKASVNKNGKAKKIQGIYLGFMFGASVNQIKTQGLRKPGYDIGVIAGYQISKSLSLETGFMYDRKNYFSSGEYFDMSKLSATMPASMKLLSMEGSCSVFEIPVKIKYNLRSKGNSHFYSTAGISSYIMTNEYNKYRSVTNGTEQNITGKYSDNARYLAAALDVSLGYESKIGSYGNIRIEPYLQIPLKGIGMGSLPVMTAGLHIGFTRPIR